MKRDFRKESITRELRRLGFTHDNDRELIPQMAVCVRDHDHLRAILAKVEPAKRAIAYEAFRSHLRFTPKPLEVYLSEAAQLAEQEKLPVWDEKSQTITTTASAPIISIGSMWWPSGRSRQPRSSSSQKVA